MPYRPPRHQPPAPPAAARPSPSRRGYGPDWDRCRLAYLADHPECEQCSQAGVLTAATEVDHVRRIERGGPRFDHENLMALCKSCHSKKTVRETATFGWQRPPVPVVLIAGPPGAGKSTLARDRAGPGFLVVDVDSLAAALSGQPAHATDDRYVPFAAAARDAVLDRLCRGESAVTGAVVLTASPREHQVRSLADRLAAELVVLAPPAAVCLARCQADPGRGRYADRWPALIAAWFAGWGGSADPILTSPTSD
ncbi:MAG: HNH endonuclease [Gemmataceae bacterium]